MKAKYRTIPELSPYINHKSYLTFKENHKFFIKELKKRIKKKDSLKLIDIGCGNGQLLYQINKKFPYINCTGTDKEVQFINSAKKFVGLRNVNFMTKDFFKNRGTYDFVFCTSVFQIFQDYKKPLTKLLSLTKKNGYLFVDGLFNKYDVEVRLQYCDNSNDIAKNLWRSDWSQHSIKLIGKFLKSKKISSYKFLEIPMNKTIKFNKKIHVNQFTFKSKKKNLITNGTNLILNRNLLIVKK